MKKCAMIILTLGLVYLAACTPTIYGVPQPTWEMMSEAERVEAMQLYKERQIAYQRAQEERARLRAIELQQQQARQEEEARRRQLRIDAIYRGEGDWGDLVRVTLQEGQMHIGGKHRGFQPVAFKIAAGESKQVTVYSIAGRRSTLQVSYDGGTLVIDDYGRGNNSRAKRFVYDGSWDDGRTYQGVSSEGPLKLRGISAFVEVVGERSRRRARRHDRSQPQVIVIQQQKKPQPTQIEFRPQRPRAQKPQVVIVKEEQPAPSPQVVVIKEEQNKAQPQVVVIRKEKEEPQPQVVIIQDRESTTGAEEKEAIPGHQKRTSTQKRLKRSKSTPVVEAKPKGMEGSRLQPKNNSAKAPIQQPLRAPERIRVTINQGQAKVRGKYLPLEPVSFQLNAGQTKDIRVKTAKGSETLTVSYRDTVLYVDGNPANMRGKSAAAQMKFDPHWHKGQSYRVDSKGKLNLKGAEVMVLAAD